MKPQKMVNGDWWVYYANRGDSYWAIKRRKGSRHSKGMKGYSAGAAQGKGLTDAAQHTYNALRRSKLTSGVDRAIFDREAMTFSLKGSDMFKGLYNIPGAPQYAGGTVDYTALSPTQQQQVMGAIRKKQGIGSSQYGAITTGRGKGYPSWVTEMLNKANAPEKSKSILPIGLAVIALKVLL